MKSVTMGQTVRTTNGDVDPLPPGYEGEVYAGKVVADGDIKVEIFVTRLPSGMMIPRSHELRLTTWASKLEPIGG